MGSGRVDRKSNPAKARSSSSKPRVAPKQATKKRCQKWSKDRSENVRDALNRDTDLLYTVLENQSGIPLTFSQTDSVVSLAEGMQGLGK